MKVAILFDLSEPGGVQTCVYSLIKGLNREGIIPDVLWDVPPSKTLIEENNLKLNFAKINFKIPTCFIKRMPDTIRYLLRPFNAIRISKIPEKYDFIFSFMPIILIDVLRPHLIYLSGPPLLPQLYSKSLFFKAANFLYKLLIKPSHPIYEPQKNANYVINSKFTAKLFKEAHGFDLDVIYPSNQISFKLIKNDELFLRDTITFFSRIVPYKRPELLIKLAKYYSDYRFVIMGGVSRRRINYLKKLKRLLIKEDIKNLVLVPNATKNDIDEILQKTKIYFFPAINEHFGITTIEAIATGCIPFVHNSGGQVEIVPIEELRFDDFNMLEKFNALLTLPEDSLNDYRKKLLNHCQYFSEEVFIDKILTKAGIK